MATLQKRGEKWFAQVRRTGHPSQSKSFATKAEALAWAVQAEARIANGLKPLDAKTLRETTLGDLLIRYGRDISPSKRGSKEEQYRVNRIAKTPLGMTNLASLTPRMIAAYRDDRLRTVGRSSVRSELSLIRQTLEIGRREWCYPLPDNPCALVTLPKPAECRERRLEEGEYDLIDHALSECSEPMVRPVFQFAVETAMRRGEILSLQWKHIDLERRTAFLPRTKNGKPRMVPLTPRAVAILTELPHREGAVFPVTANALRYQWALARERAGLPDLHFHDCRREGVSRLLELGLSVLETAMISGHRDLRMLSVYANLRAHDLADKLASLTGQGRGSLGGATGSAGSSEASPAPA